MGIQASGTGQTTHNCSSMPRAVRRTVLYCMRLLIVAPASSEMGPGCLLCLLSTVNHPLSVVWFTFSHSLPSGPCTQVPVVPMIWD